jgi:DNA-binding NtrC family response regulator
MPIGTAESRSDSVYGVRGWLAALELATGVPFAGHVAALLDSARLGQAVGVYHRVMADVERELLTQAITLAGGNLTRAARWLGTTRLTLREKLAAFGVR